MRAKNHADVIKANPLRFIRSSSSSLPPQVLHELEETFGAPVVEAYGMTEAAHQMACNPLPPGERKPGTVGIAAGPEVCILGDDGHPAPAGVTGEVSIRGPNVMKGYENNPKANAEAFTNGWFRTGDQGVMDEAGYVSLTGRLKEIINRGGEKISPREIDEVLMDHPAVQQCLTFAMPHDKLGEEVAVIVVLREGVEATVDEIREFAAKRLADFKVPKKVLFRPEIPKGATGKLQRIGLAQKLGLA
jgi:acyl-CoA synthetase (AMP-forming)/AMP-acid ligase II